jgi:adsorption protein B
VATALGWAGQATLRWRPAAIGDGMRLLLALNAALLVWRLGMRSHFASRCYGWRQGLMSVPRAFVANIIAILAARRAIALYCRMLGSGQVVWDKTEHLENDQPLEYAIVPAAVPQ